LTVGDGKRVELAVVVEVDLSVVSFEGVDLVVVTGAVVAVGEDVLGVLPATATSVAVVVETSGARGIA